MSHLYYFCYSVSQYVGPHDHFRFHPPLVLHFRRIAAYTPSDK